MPVNWYINLPERAGFPEGPEVLLETGRTGVKSNSNSLTWTVAQAGPDDINTVDADYYFTTGTGADARETETNEEDDTQFRTKLKLPPYGLDEYEVQVRRKDLDGSARKNVRLVARRKIFYVVNYPNTAKMLRIWNHIQRPLEAIFADVGIDLELIAAATLHANMAAADFRLQSFKDACVQAQGIPHNHQGMVMRLVLCDEAIACDDTTFRVVMREQPTQHEVNNGLPRSHWDDNNQRWTITIQSRQMKFPAEDLLGDQTYITFRDYTPYKELESNFTDMFGGVSGHGDNFQVHIPHTLRRVNDHEIELTITDGAKSNAGALHFIFEGHRDDHQNGGFLLKPNSTPELELTVKTRRGPMHGGASDGANILLSAGASYDLVSGAVNENRAFEVITNTMAHEIGHAFGLAARTLNYNGGDQPHPGHYDDTNGGHGPHCKGGSHLVDNTDNAAGEFYESSSNAVQVYRPIGTHYCTMFHQMSLDMHNCEFCVDCKRFLRAQDLSAQNLAQLSPTVRWNQVY